jgi:phosphate-selective porin OprO/OprP
VTSPWTRAPVFTSGSWSWAAYSAPPVAIPIRYYDARKWNKFDTKPISGLITGALMLDRQFWLSQDGESEAQVGELKDFEGGREPRLAHS